MGYARILYNKGLYHQSLKVLNRIKQTAKAAHQLTFQMQAIFFEKKIESLHITRSMENRAEALAQESEEITTTPVVIKQIVQPIAPVIQLVHQNGACTR